MCHNGVQCVGRRSSSLTSERIVSLRLLHNLRYCSLAASLPLTGASHPSSSARFHHPRKQVRNRTHWIIRCLCIRVCYQPIKQQIRLAYIGVNVLVPWKNITTRQIHLRGSANITPTSAVAKLGTARSIVLHVILANCVDTPAMLIVGASTLTLRSRCHSISDTPSSPRQLPAPC